MRVKVWLKRKLLACAFQLPASGYYSLLQMLHTGRMADSIGHRVSEPYRSEHVHVEQISSMIVVNGTHFTTETRRLQAPLSNRGPVYEF